MKDSFLEYAEKLNSGSFECWSEDSVKGYKTALISLTEYYKSLGGLSYWQINEIISRLEFIKGNVIVDQRRDAMQQIKELLDFTNGIQDKIIQSGHPGR